MSRVLKNHEIMRKQIYQQLKAVFINAAHVSNTKNDIPIQIGQGFNSFLAIILMRERELVLSFHCLTDVSLK